MAGRMEGWTLRASPGRLQLSHAEDRKERRPTGEGMGDYPSSHLPRLLISKLQASISLSSFCFNDNKENSDL